MVKKIQNTTPKVCPKCGKEYIRTEETRGYVRYIHKDMSKLKDKQGKVMAVFSTIDDVCTVKKT